MKFEFYAETETAWCYFTGRSTGDFWKKRERRAICKSCGMDYQLPGRHGIVDLARCTVRGMGFSTVGGVCSECGDRYDQTLTYMRDNTEFIDICPHCIVEHHGLDFILEKYRNLSKYLLSRQKKVEGEK